MSETTDSSSPREERLKRIVAALIATMTVLAALVTVLQANAGAQSANANRDAQRFAIQAMGLKTTGQTQGSYEWQGAFQTWSELNDLALNADSAGDEPAATRYRTVRDRVAGLSRLLTNKYFDPDSGDWPNYSQYEADIYYVRATELSERYADAAVRYDAWGDKANAHIVHLTLLAVSLSLYGLSTTLSSRARVLFIAAGSGIATVTIVWTLAVFLAPIPQLPDAAMEAYANGVGLAYQGKTHQAIDAFNDALADAPGYANALYERANAYYELVDYETATADYEAARAAGRDDTNVGWNLGWTYYLLGRFDDAIQTDVRVVTLDPRLIGVRLNLGLARLANGENATAKADYEEAIAEATRQVAEARAASQEPPSSLWFYLDAGVLDLQNLLDQLNGQPKSWTQAPAADTVDDPESVERIAQDFIEQLKNTTVALEYTGRPPDETLRASLSPLEFGQAVYDDQGDFVKYDIATEFAYETKEVRVLFDYERMEPGQSVLFKVYRNGSEYTTLRKLVEWPEDLGESGSAEYPLSYAYSELFIFPDGEFTVDVYVDSNLAQTGDFTILAPGVEPTTPVIEDGDVLYSDDFEDSDSGWPRTQKDDYVTDYADGVYQINVIGDGLSVWATPGQDLAGVSITVDATKVGGPDANNFGVVCRYQDAENFYSLAITSDGYYAISKYQAGEWNFLSGDDWQASDAINQGDASNSLRADCVGDTLSLYVNDELLAEVQDADFASGDVGVIAGSFDTGGVDVLFDDFVVTASGVGIEPVADSGDILYSDHFEDSDSGWPSTRKDDYVTDYADGVYQVNVIDDSLTVWATPGLDLADVSITVDATKVGGPDANNFGVVCRYQDAENFYSLAITSDGYFAISKYQAGEWNFLSGDDWQASDVIGQGDASNSLRADCVGDTLSLYVNDELVGEVQDADFVSGDAGVIAGSFDTGGVDILFDDFVVTQP